MVLQRENGKLSIASRAEVSETQSGISVGVSIILVRKETTSACHHEGKVDESHNVGCSADDTAFC